MIDEVVVVISDIHSNGLALEAAIKQAHSSHIDKLIILGDLLTYGLDVNRVFDIVAAEVDNGAILILGNHDEMYLDLINNKMDYYNTLPEWIKESIDYNFNKLDTKVFSNFNWIKSITRNNILYSHANPYDDWRYLNSIQDLQEAAEILKSKGLLAGVFGHNHRPVCFSISDQKTINVSEGFGIFVLNPGSIGQPRFKPPVSTLLRLSISNNKLWAEIEPVIYNTQQQNDEIRTSTLSELTKNKLVAFFQG
jgi:predicted phosphodiesterase